MSDKVTNPEAEWYETPTLGHRAMLAITGLNDRRVQIWYQRGYLAKRTRQPAPGRGTRRKYSPGEVLFLAYTRVLADAGVHLDQAAFFASIFPTLWGLVFGNTADMLRASADPMNSPRVFAVITPHDGRQSFESDPVAFMTRTGANIEAAVVVNFTRFVNVTMARIRNASDNGVR